jgi:hypothetical protein
MAGLDVPQIENITGVWEAMIARCYRFADQKIMEGGRGTSVIQPASAACKTFHTRV